MLFDRSNDPDLRKNLIKAHPAEAEKLKAAWTHWPVERTRQRVIRSNQFSLVARPELEGGYQLSLYNHAADPKMNEDVQDKHPGIMAELSTHLQAWHTELDESNEPVLERTKEQEEALRSLGYIE